jgi:hypothetical protein
MEYGQYAPRGYDVANSLNETWVGYTGRFPGFGYDLVGTISTHLLGKYRPEVMFLNEKVQQQNAPNYSPFSHPFIQQYLNEPIDNQHTSSTPLPFPTPQERLNHLVKVWDQPEDEQVGKTIQHILLGQNATIPFNLSKSTLSSSSDDIIPSFRPREIMWAEGVLTGYYHSILMKNGIGLGVEHVQSNLFSNTNNTNDDNIDNIDKKSRYEHIYPFRNHLLIHPEQVSKLPTTHPLYNNTKLVEKMINYTLPKTLSQWLKEQIPLLLFEAMLMQLGSFLMWSMWGLIMTETKSQHGYGYIDHSIVRLFAYVTKKHLLVQLGLLDHPPHLDL